MPNARVKVLVLWSPIRPQDNQASASEASAFLADSRVEHFWDLWSFGLKKYTRLLNYPSGEIAWDIFILYQKNVTWDGSPPQPTVWLQNRNIPLGVKYSQERLKTELQKLAQ